MHNNEKNTFFNIFRIISKRLLPSLFWILLIFSFDELHIAQMTLIAIIIHETGHILYLYIIGKKAKEVYSSLQGLRIKGDARLSYMEEFWLYISGPAANLIASFVAFVIPANHTDFSKTFIAINLVTALSNLLPIKSYDGYGMMRALFALHSKSVDSHSLLTKISFSFQTMLCLLSLYFMARYGGCYWIFAVFFISMLKELAKMLQNTKFEQ